MHLGCLAAATLLAVLAGPVFAQQPHGTMPGHGMAGGASSREMMQAMERMNRDMTQGLTGDPDHDFARMMAAHHQGAIDMAQAYLSDGKDRRLREMAEKVVKEQQAEIAELQDWLLGNGTRR
ncbi:CopM family metallochaperone [Arenibaculum pallidiluteum]|uniref:CopM family metallochaperone n=1 Tax=Arenibaculum pallidiluteum TaxID=2812559 RepID=UPI001A965029|nr:DUF305 domain-containing protein [Arenibaculum pallidiluteum]